MKLAQLIHDSVRVKVDPSSLFDVQVKRIHGYKRQLLNMMHIIDEYLALTQDRREPLVPRTYIFAGKAAPGYWKAKQIIELIHNVVRVINGDSRAAKWLKVVFLPDYRVSLAEKIFPAVDLGEQISTAGMEASGTSNMKMALNHPAFSSQMRFLQAILGGTRGWRRVVARSCLKITRRCDLEHCQRLGISRYSEFGGKYLSVGRFR